MAGIKQTARDQLRRRLSQNFLVGHRAIQRFLAAAALHQSDLVVEIGAGTGALTSRIAPQCRRLIAYELDARFAARLEEQFTLQENISIVRADFLDAEPPGEPFQLVGNVPFSATAQVIRWALSAPSMESGTFITQLEYAKKRCGGFGRWSLLTVLTWPEFRWEMHGRIAPSEFRPVPRVGAAILRLERRAEPLVPTHRIGRYRKLVELGFQGAGGSLCGSLKRSYPAHRVSMALETAGVRTDEVVAFVSADQWLVIFTALHGAPSCFPR